MSMGWRRVEMGNLGGRGVDRIGEVEGWGAYVDWNRLVLCRCSCCVGEKRLEYWELSCKIRNFCCPFRIINGSPMLKVPSDPEPPAELLVRASISNCAHGEAVFFLNLVLKSCWLVGLSCGDLHDATNLQTFLLRR